MRHYNGVAHKGRTLGFLDSWVLAPTFPITAAFTRHDANFALVVDVNASSKEHQAQDQAPENKHND